MNVGFVSCDQTNFKATAQSGDIEGSGTFIGGEEIHRFTGIIIKGHTDLNGQTFEADIYGEDAIIRFLGKKSIGHSLIPESIQKLF